MSMKDFSNLLRVFQKGEAVGIKRKELLKEVALVTLARATSSDTHIHPIEVETVQRTLKTIIGEEVPSAEIRLAANSALFEKAPLAKYLTRAARMLGDADRLAIVRALEEVIKSDVRVSAFETEFYDMVAESLNLTPSQLVGMDSD